MANNGYQFFDIQALLRQGDLDIMRVAGAEASMTTDEYFGLLSDFILYAPDVKISLSKFSDLNGEKEDYKKLDRMVNLLDRIGSREFVIEFHAILNAYGKSGNWREAAARAKQVMESFNKFYLSIVSAKRKEGTFNATGEIEEWIGDEDSGRVRGEDSGRVRGEDGGRVAYETGDGVRGESGNRPGAISLKEYVEFLNEKESAERFIEIQEEGRGRGGHRKPVTPARETPRPAMLGKDGQRPMEPRDRGNRNSAAYNNDDRSPTAPIKGDLSAMDDLTIEFDQRPVVLAVDDSPVVLKSVSSVLSTDYKVYTLPKPTRLKGFLEQITPDLFILDYLMPEVNGFELIPVIRSFEEHKDTPVIYLTSEGTVSNVTAALSLGASDFIVKPFEPQVLREKVEKWIAVK